LTIATAELNMPEQPNRQPGRYEREVLCSAPPDPALVPDAGCCLVYQHRGLSLFIEPAGAGRYHVTAARMTAKGLLFEGTRHPCLGPDVPAAVQALGAESAVAQGVREQRPATEVPFHNIVPSD
jgi:hypothetical protein